MKINDVPQDDAGFLKEGKVRDVCYATDEEGKYTQVLSVGWDPKNEAIRQAWDQIHAKAEKVRQKVLKGKLSPLAFHMERDEYLFALEIYRIFMDESMERKKARGLQKP
jgi:hypothetical protein